MEYSKEDLMEAKKQIWGVGENMGTEESKKIWEENAQFWDNAMGDESNEFHREVVRPKVTELLSPNPADYILDAKWIKPYIIVVEDLFEINGTTISATVGNEVNVYSFVESFNACSDCTWSLYSDYLGTNELVLKNMPLNYGMNTAYIVVWSADKSAFTQYTLNVYRLSILDYSFDVFGETYQSGQIEEQSALNAPTNPEVAHYIFEGWYVGDLQITFPYTVHKNAQIVAKMTPIEYDLLYELNGGNNDENNPSTYNVETLTSVLAGLQPASKDYYTFTKWDISEQDNQKIESLTLGTLTLIAEFTPIDYSITYHLNGGAFAEISESSYNIETPDITLSVPTRTGYTFMGWYDNASFDGEAVTTIPTGSHGQKEFYIEYKEE